MSNVESYTAGDLTLCTHKLCSLSAQIQTLNAAGIVELLLPETVTSYSCSPEGVTFLHRHCARTKMPPTARNAYFPIRYHLQDAVENVNSHNWIDTVLPESHRDSIKAHLPFF